MKNNFAMPMTGLVLLVTSCASFAVEDDRTAILALMDKAFAAVSSGNPDDWRAIQLADGTTLSFRPHTDGTPDKLEMRMSQNEAFVAGSVDDGHEYLEKWTSDPTILLRGPIGVVWGEYDFWINGQFSHCGVDAVDVVKIDGKWQIANFMWTVEKQGCPADPNR